MYSEGEAVSYFVPKVWFVISVADKLEGRFRSRRSNYWVQYSLFHILGV